MNTDADAVREVGNLMRRAKIDLSTEKRAQAEIAQLLNRAGIGFEREVRLTGSDIIDFMVGPVGIEVKLRGAKKTDVYRQLCRYASHPRVSSLVLASNLSMGLPATVGGKDAYFVRLGEGWL